MVAMVVKSLGKVEKPVKPKVPATQKALKEVQEEEMKALDREFKFREGPLQNQVDAIQQEFTSSVVEHGAAAQVTMDIAARLEEAAKRLQTVKNERKVLEAEMKRSCTSVHLSGLQYSRMCRRGFITFHQDSAG